MADSLRQILMFKISFLKKNPEKILNSNEQISKISGFSKKFLAKFLELQKIVELFRTIPKAHKNFKSHLETLLSSK